MFCGDLCMQGISDGFQNHDECSDKPEVRRMVCLLVETMPMPRQGCFGPRRC